VLRAHLVCLRNVPLAGSHLPDVRTHRTFVPPEACVAANKVSVLSADVRRVFQSNPRNVFDWFSAPASQHDELPCCHWWRTQASWPALMSSTCVLDSASLRITLPMKWTVENPQLACSCSCRKPASRRRSGFYTNFVERSSEGSKTFQRRTE
jgi:hypothetical protein